MIVLLVCNTTSQNDSLVASSSRTIFSLICEMQNVLHTADRMSRDQDDLSLHDGHSVLRLPII